ncbi:hypothetical protein ACFL6I_01155 [candidate division KSB1 bacterium]
MNKHFLLFAGIFLTLHGNNPFLIINCHPYSVPKGMASAIVIWVVGLSLNFVRERAAYFT